MNTLPPTYRIDGKYILATALIVSATWLLHEGVHWAMGSALGYDMAMSLNKSYPVNGTYNSDSHYQLISAAGPVITLLEAILVFVIMHRQKKYRLYPVLFTCFYMRLLAAGMSLLNPNDETRISESLGIGLFTLPLFMITILFILLYKTSRQYRFSTKFNLITLVLIILFSSVIILADQFWDVRLL